MIARMRDQLDCQIFVFVALYTRRQRLINSFSLKLAVATQDRTDDDVEVPLLPPLLGLVSVLQECIVVLALWDILRCITLLGELVVDETQLATLLTGRDSVQADVELGAVVGVRVLGMGVELAKLISRGLLWAGEPVVRLVSISLALLPVGHLGPVANTAVLIEPEAGAAGVLLCGAVHASVEDVAHTRVRVRVEPVQAGAQVAGTLGGLELKPVATVDVKVVIARLPLSAEGVKDKTIWAQPVLWDVVKTVVVFVALNSVGEVAVPLRTSEVGLG